MLAHYEVRATQWCINYIAFPLAPFPFSLTLALVFQAPRK